jgi:signal transduction histidine kinase
VYPTLSQQTWKPRTSVKVRFALAQGVFIAAIIALLALTLYVPVRQRLVSITDNTYKILADNLASTINTPYESGNLRDVINAVRRVEGQQGIKYILVVDKDSNVVYDTITGDGALQNTTLNDQLTEKVQKGDIAVGKVTRSGATYYNYVAPFIAKNQVDYTVRLGVDEQVIDGEFIRLARLFLYLGAAGIILGIITSYLLVARMTKPIIALTESALAIRAGNLNAYPTIVTNDELEQLAREFQRMVEKLKQFYFQEYSQKKQAVEAKKKAEEVNLRLKELDRQKTDFLNAASHQLRTPLSVIHWSLSLIVDEFEKLHLPEQEQELLNESLKSTKRMVDLVNDLLDLSRMEQGRKELDWSLGNFGQVCTELVKALQPLANNKGLELTYVQEGEVPDSYLDAKSFYQVVNNFVDNAVKYTKEGYVHVTAKQVEDHLEIRIKDSGIGMNEAERARLFTRFSRGDEAAKMFANGSGLGMFVAHEILRQHGGEVTVESEKGQGTAFILSVPLYKEVPTPVEPADQLPVIEANQAATKPTTPEKSEAVVSSVPDEPAPAPAEPVIEVVAPSTPPKSTAKRAAKPTTKRRRHAA